MPEELIASVLGDAKPGAAVVPPVANGAADANKPADQPGAKPDGTDKGADKGADGVVKPEEVKYDLKAPEGIDAESVTKFVDVAKELKIAPEQAQKLVEWYGKNALDKATGAADAWKATNDGWVNTAKADTEIGGANFDKSVADSKAAIQKFGGPKFIEALNFTGMGNHPEMIRFLSKVAKAFGEDKLVSGSGVVDQPKSAADILFPSQNK